MIVRHPTFQSSSVLLFGAWGMGCPRAGAGRRSYLGRDRERECAFSWMWTVCDRMLSDDSVEKRGESGVETAVKLKIWLRPTKRGENPFKGRPKILHTARRRKSAEEARRAA